MAPSDVSGDELSTDLMKYDKAGNLIWDNYSAAVGQRGSMTYDAENRMKSSVNNSHQYYYDADGKRTRRLVAGSAEMWLVYGVNGELVAEYDAVMPGGTLKKENGYRGGQMLIVYDSTLAGDNQLKWMVTDHLGSTRILVNRSGGLCGAIERRDYLPFGEELVSTIGHRNATCAGYVGGNNPRQKFGSKERDNETGLDYFGARYFATVQGRFTSVDPLLLSAKTAEPQTWNRYTYALNNPLVFVDPSGEIPQQANNRTASSSNGRTRGEAGFAIKHPVAATRIGRLDETGRSDNISTIAARFTNRIGLQEGDRTFDGSQVNAARHALWQAMITREFGASVATQAGAAHERNPHVDLSVNTFGGNNALAEADQTIDLLNEVCA